MSTERKLAINSIVQIGGKIASTLLGLVSIALMTRYLSTEQFGWYTTAISFLQFAGILTDFGLIPVTAQMLSDPKFERSRLLSTLFTFRFVTAIICFIITPCIALFFPYPKEVIIAIFLSAISFVAVALNQICIGYYQTTLRTHIHALGEFTGRLTLVIGLALLIHFGASFLPIMGILVLANLVFTAFMLVDTLRHEKIRFMYDEPLIKEITTRMWPIALSITCNVVYLRGDALLLPFFRSQSEVGLYGAAYRVLDIVSQTGMLLMGLLLPLLASTWATKNSEKFRLWYQRSFDLMLMAGLPICLATIFLASQIIQTVAGEKYAASALPLAILGVAMFGVYVGAVFGHTAVAIGRQKETIWIYLSNAVITLAGYLIFIPLYGMVGAAALSTFSEVYAGILLFIVVSRYTGVRLEYRVFFKILLAGLCMAGLLYVLRDYMYWILALMVSSGIYLAVLFLTKALTKQTIQTILKKDPVV
jgi:O-antigen/teichoic acid export membrane protein